MPGEEREHMYEIPESRLRELSQAAERAEKAEAEAAEYRADAKKGWDAYEDVIHGATEDRMALARLREALETIQQMLSADPGRSSLLGTVLSAESIARAALSNPALSNPPTGEGRTEKRPTSWNPWPATSREGTD